MNPGGLNSGPHACTEGTLLTEPSLQPSIFKSLYFIELQLCAGNPKNLVENKNCFHDADCLRDCQAGESHAHMAEIDRGVRLAF